MLEKLCWSGHVANLMEEEGLGLDVVSGGVIYRIKAGFPSERIYFHGNNKSRRELEEALEAGIGRIVVDSMPSLKSLRSCRGSTAKNPDFNPC